MPKSIDQEPLYGQPGEGGFWPDPDPSLLFDTNGTTPVIVKGRQYQRVPGIMQIGTRGETVQLPPETGVTATVIEQLPDGMFHQRPAGPDEIGGGLQIVARSEIDPAVSQEAQKNYEASSHKVLQLPK
jgi:hypothetical protein